ncbi:hypothetical protein BP5796_08269 [Coleophoma crateriformis]|uniref:Uncharacterized protein n=1 Tax=Coleophoma crateriformis TaxID=565419 RepID=A0A3D8RDW8_9HELO|nr:hypothetical protein BP5796_08269 [Coleophoma crateriformis]
MTRSHEDHTPGDVLMSTTGARTRGLSPPAPVAAPSIVVFNTSGTGSSDPVLCSTSIPTSWADAKLTGFVKRGRPRKGRKTAPRSSEKTKGLGLTHSNNKSDFNFINCTPTTQISHPEIRKVVRSNAMLHFRRLGRGSLYPCSRIRQDHDTEPIEEVSAVNSSSGSLDVAETEEGHWEQSKLKSNEQQQDGTLDRRVRSVLVSALTLPLEIGDTDPFDVFPLKIKPYMLDLLTKYATSIYETMYSIEKYAAINPVKECWLPMAFQDGALLHTILACADIYGSPYWMNHPTALMHISKAVTMVSERLLGPTPEITDATIVVVCALAYSEMVNNNQENWRVHMRGLKQMVHLRGGIEAFESTPMIQNKISRADLCGSLSAVQKPYFDFPRECLAIPPLSNHMTHFRGVRSAVELDNRLLQILWHVEHAVFNLNRIHINKADIHPMAVRKEITSLQYALLSFGVRRNDVREELMHEVLRLSMLVYLVIVLDESPPGLPIYKMLGVDLVAALKELGLESSLEPKFLLWITFVGASFDQNAQNSDYFMASAAKMSKRLGISSWESAEVVLKSFFWVDKTQSYSFSRVWDSLEL